MISICHTSPLQTGSLKRCWYCNSQKSSASFLKVIELYRECQGGGVVAINIYILLHSCISTHLYSVYPPRWSNFCGSFTHLGASKLSQEPTVQCLKSRLALSLRLSAKQSGEDGIRAEGHMIPRQHFLWVQDTFPPVAAQWQHRFRAANGGRVKKKVHGKRSC